MGDMSIPLQSASIYDGQEVFSWFDCLLDLGKEVGYAQPEMLQNVH